MSDRWFISAPRLGRRAVLSAVIGVFTAALSAAQEVRGRPFRIAFANLTEEPGVHVEGLGFTGAEVRRSFELASRTLPIDMIYYDNNGDGEKALANAEEAIRRRIDLFIEYNSDVTINGVIADRLRVAGIPILAVNYPVPGAPLYTADNLLAGRIAGTTLGQFARQNWFDQTVVAAIAGDLGDPAPYVADRVRGIIEGLRQEWPQIPLTRVDTNGNPVRLEGLLSKFLASQSRRKVLVATLDDLTALAAKLAIEIAGRMSDCVIVGQGVDRNVHGGAGDKKEIDPNNRGSILLGSVAYYLDRYGYDVLPLGLKVLRGEPVPPRITTKHILISARNVFAEYPPYDMN